MENTPDFEQDPVKDAAQESALQAAGDELFADYVPSGLNYDEIDFGETFDESGDLIEETDEDLEESEEATKAAQLKKEKGANL